MTETRISRWLAVGLALVVALSVGGRTSAQDESDARDAIAQALALLDEADSYAYAVTMDTSTRLTDEAGDSFGTQQRYEISGETSGADYQDTTTLTVVPLEAEDEAQTIRLERVQVGETLYVQLDDLLAEQLGVESGWWAMEDLLNALGEDSVLRFSAEQLATLPTPATLTLEDDLIRSVEEVESGEIDGAPVRVFDVEMKAVELAIAQQAEQDASEALTAYLENAALLLQSEISLTYRLSIGADDGRLYRVESASRTYLPFLEAGVSGPDYNVDTTTTLTFDLSAYDAPVEIEAPLSTVG